MSEEKEYTGGSVSYYAVDVNAPINEASDPYTAECQDIIEALKLDFNEGNVLKAIWRRAAARLGRSKKGYDDGLYDAEKIVFYGQRLVAIERRAERVVVESLSDTLVAELIADGPEFVRIQNIVDKWPKGNNSGREAAGAKTETDPYGPRDAEGWYTWNSDETMRPAGRVRIKLRNGHVGSDHADVCDWVHRNLGLDIVQWKPEEFGGEPKRPAQ